MTRYYLEYIDERDPKRPAVPTWRPWTGVTYPDQTKADAACRHLQTVADDCKSYLIFRVAQKQTKTEKEPNT